MQSNNDISTETNPLKGILMCLLGYFFVSLIGICKKSIHSDVSLPFILFSQNIVCFALIIWELRYSKINVLKINDVNTYVIRIVSGLGCYAALFYVIKFLPVSEAFLYQYSSSLWVPFIMSIWLGVKMPKNNWFGILIGFLGIIIILQPATLSLGLVSIIGIICGILQAVSVIAIRKLSVTEPIQRILFYYFLAGTLISSLLLIHHSITIQLIDFPWLLGVGITTYIAQKFLTISLKYAHATTLAPICYASILFSGVLGWIFWSEVPSNTVLLGMGLVMCGCLLSVLTSRPQPKAREILVPE